MSLIAVHPDLVVTSAEGIPQLLVEAKSHRNIPAAMAAEWHHRASAYNPACFALFVATDKFWLWAPGGTTPTYEGDTMSLLERYINLDKVPLATVRGEAFESLIYAWLGSVIFKPANVLLELPAQRWLVETGLHPLIYRGYIQWESNLA
jgi:hypothetical protein